MHEDINYCPQCGYDYCICHFINYRDPHDLLWKFWASERIANEIWLREVYWGDGFWTSEGLSQILKKEWFR